MRLVPDENWPLPSIRRLRQSGHDVLAILEEARGAHDSCILSLSTREDRVLLTFDRDFGELVFRQGQPAPAGVVYFRLDPVTPEEPADLLLTILAGGMVILSGKFTVVDRRHIRQRPLP